MLLSASGCYPLEMSSTKAIAKVFTSASVSRTNDVHKSRLQLERRNRNKRSKIEDFTGSRARLLSRDFYTAAIRQTSVVLNSQASHVEYIVFSRNRRLEIIARTIVLYVIRGSVRSID